eukprot:GEMP01033534.1.p1 GENE.GEMP01033534.1~~GEMP01033534.1.p1  ORF type:complete len:609 (+),score=86.43 GEMP01033534.1:75-1829(+)
MEHYRVISRIRPSNDEPFSVQSHDPKHLRVTDHAGVNVDLRLDHVFGQDCDQGHVYAEIKKQILAPVCVSGRKAALVCYGQTGSGKTYTMFGPSEDGKCVFSGENRGVVPRALEDFLSMTNVVLTLSFVQVYNDKITDLLSSGRILTLRETAESMSIKGLKSVVCRNLHEALSVVQNGLMRRNSANNEHHAHSSRSHAILQISFPNGGKVSLCDLAGSERVNKKSRSHMDEATSINQSLSALSNCISALKERRPHVPYRNSKLTRLLRDSLLGDSMMSMIICLDPSLAAMDETTRSLQFVDRAKMVELSQPTKDSEQMQKTDSSQWEDKLKNLENELAHEKAERLYLERLLLIRPPQHRVVPNKLSPVPQLQPHRSLLSCASNISLAPRPLVQYRSLAELPRNPDSCAKAGVAPMRLLPVGSGIHLGSIGLAQPVQWGPTVNLRPPSRTMIPEAVAEALTRFIERPQKLRMSPSLKVFRTNTVSTNSGFSCMPIFENLQQGFPVANARPLINKCAASETGSGLITTATNEGSIASKDLCSESSARIRCDPSVALPPTPDLPPKQGRVPRRKTARKPRTWSSNFI